MVDVFLEPFCEALNSIRQGDEGESKEKSQATSKLSQQGGERIEEHLKMIRMLI